MVSPRPSLSLSGLEVDVTLHLFQPHLDRLEGVKGPPFFCPFSHPLSS